MPSKSYIQHKLFESAYHNEEIAEKRGIKKEVAKEFLDADKEAGIWQQTPSKSNPQGRVDENHPHIPPKDREHSKKK
jgi:hypothetical protein